MSLWLKKDLPVQLFFTDTVNCYKKDFFVGKTSGKQYYISFRTRTREYCILNLARQLWRSSAVIIILPFIFISERELMFMFAICRRPSVCLSVCLSSVVCNVRAPHSGD